MAIEKGSAAGKTTGLATSSDIGQLTAAVTAGFQTVSPLLKVTDYELTKPDALTGNFDFVNPNGGSASAANGIIRILAPPVNNTVFLYSKSSFSLPLQAMFAVWSAFGTFAGYPSGMLETGFVSLDPVTGNADFSNYVTVQATEYQSTTTLTLYEAVIKVCNNNVSVTKYFNKQLNDQHAESYEPAPNNQAWYPGISQLTVNHKGVFFDYGTSGYSTHDQRADYFEQLPDMTRQYKFFIKYTMGGGQVLNFGFLRVFESGAPRLPVEVSAYNKLPVYFPEAPNVNVSGNVGISNQGATPLKVTVTNAALTVAPYQSFPVGNAGNLSGKELRGVQAANLIVNLPYKNASALNLPGLQAKLIRWGIYLEQAATAQVQVSDDAVTWRNDPDFLITLIPGRFNKIEYPVYWTLVRLQFINGIAPQSINFNAQYAMFC